MESYLETRQNLKMVFMLVDLRHKPTEDDILMYNYLKHYNIPLTIVCTKADKLSKNNQIKQISIITKTFEINKEDLILFSSITKLGRQEVHDKLVETLDIPV